jgi:hypothetical protein
VYLNQTCFLAGMFLLPNSLSRVTGSAQVCSPYLRNTPQSRPISLEYQLLTRGPKRSLLLRPRIPNMLPLFIHNYTNRHGDSKLRKLFPQLCISPTSCVFKTSRLLLPSHLPLPPTFFLSSLLSSLLFSSLLFSSLLFSSLLFPSLLFSPLLSSLLLFESFLTCLARPFFHVFTLDIYIGIYICIQTAGQGIISRSRDIARCDCQVIRSSRTMELRIFGWK